MTERTQTLAWIVGILIAIVGMAVLLFVPILTPALTAFLLGAGFHYRRASGTRELAPVLLICGFASLIPTLLIASSFAGVEHSVIGTGSQIP